MPEIKILTTGAIVVAAIMALGIRFTKEDPACLELAQNAMQRFSQHPEDPQEVQVPDCELADLIRIDAAELSAECGSFKFITTRTAQQTHDALLHKANAQCPSASMQGSYATHDDQEQD